MKSATKKFITAVYLLLVTTVGNAQKYYRGEEAAIEPSQVMLENYFPISLPGQMAGEPNFNRFDRLNRYSYLQLIYDNNGTNYQLLFQVNFFGKLLYVALSNNLSAVFNKADKPKNVFLNCIRKSNEHVSMLENADALVKCILDRLNYCGF